MTAHILMVDDEPDAEDLFRQNFRREIRRGAYAFLFAQSGAQALQILDDDADVTLVFSDINMPGMTGIELLSHIKETRPQVPVVMITAYGDKGTESRVQEKGAARFMTKPVDFAALKEQLPGILMAGNP